LKRHQITFARARPANKNDGRHFEQKNWAVVRTRRSAVVIDTVHHSAMRHQFRY
jgi:hypothetical protein